jgi:hypothetical protein
MLDDLTPAERFWHESKFEVVRRSIQTIKRWSAGRINNGQYKIIQSLVKARGTLDAGDWRMLVCVYVRARVCVCVCVCVYMLPYELGVTVWNAPGCVPLALSQCPRVAA